MYAYARAGKRVREREKEKEKAREREKEKDKERERESRRGEQRTLRGAPVQVVPSGGGAPTACGRGRMELCLRIRVSEGLLHLYRVDANDLD